MYMCIFPLENKFCNFNNFELNALQPIINEKIYINMMYFNLIHTTFKLIIL